MMDFNGMSMVDSQRRKLLKGTALLSSGLLAGCTGNNQSGSPNEGTATSSQGGDSGGWVHDVAQEEADKLVITNLNQISGDPEIQGHYDAFEEETGITPEAYEIAEADTLAKVRTLLQSQEATPDVYDLIDSWAYSLGTRGYFEKIDQHITTTDAWSDMAVEACTWPLNLPSFSDFPYEEGLYASPHYTKGWGLYANKNVLEEAGLSRDFRPETFQETLDALDQVQEVTDNPIVFPFSVASEATEIIHNLVQRSGGHLYDDNNDPDFMNEGFLNAMDFLLTLVEEGYSPQGVTSLSEGNVAAQLFEGDAAFMLAGLTHLFAYEVEDADRPADIATFNLAPVPEGAGDTPSGDAFLVTHNVSAFSKHKEAAIKFQNIVTSQERQKAELLIAGNLPIRPDVFDLDEVQEQVPYADVLKEFIDKQAKFIYPHQAETQQIMYSAMTEAFANGLSAEETAQNIQSQAEDI